MKIPTLVVAKHDGAKWIVESDDVYRSGGRIFFPMHTPDGQPVASLRMDEAAFDRGEQPPGFILIYD